MVNDGLTLVDFVVEGRRGKNLVAYTPEDIDYFNSLTFGQMIIDKNSGRLLLRDITKTPIETSQVIAHGPADIYFEDNLFGSKSNERKGVIGRVARENHCNAYEIFSSSLINSGEGQIAATPFRVYKIAKE